ncbi:MAG TPA: hypothetical protein VMU07_03995 [Candidatus Paceibacterota bacterium]|nr:hypothetical protein [Candidatus Paceibacterota bacterium]
MTKSWPWRNRQWIAIVVLVIVGFLLVKQLPKMEPRVLLAGTIIALIVVNSLIYLISGVDLVNFYGYEKSSVKPLPQEPFDPLAERVWLAIQTSIAEGKYDWRTPEGLSEETGMELAAIQRILKCDLGEQGLVVRVTDNDGCYYTTREHYMRIRTWTDSILSVLTGKIQ